MGRKIFICFILTILYAKSQISCLEFLEFSETNVGTKDSITFFIYNNSTHPVQIDTLILDNSVFDCQTKSFLIPSKDSVKITVYFRPNQNVIYNSFAFFKSKADKVYPIKIFGSGKYKDFYQELTFNLYDEELKTALSNYVANHTSLGYKLARKKMFETIDDLGNDTIECVYTGRRIVASSIPNVYVDHFNTEHTWPQETFDSQEPMRSDLFNLYPTDEYANAKRANYPFGNVSSNIIWENGGSILGQNSFGQIVFEPRNHHKGNVARSIFYFIIRYQQNFGTYLDTIQEDVLRNWNAIDPVDERERRRNDSIAYYQVKRNPFIDHPEFVERIWKFSLKESRSKKSRIDVYPFLNNPDTILTNVPTNLKIVLFNFGDNSFQVSSVNTTNQDFHIVNYPSSISPHSFGVVEIMVDTKSTGILENTIEVYGEGNVIKKNLLIYSINQYNSHFEITQNSISLDWDNINKVLGAVVNETFSPSFVRVYNLYGQLVFSTELQAGPYKFNLNHLAKGLFIGLIKAKGCETKAIPIISY